MFLDKVNSVPVVLTHVRTFEEFCLANTHPEVKQPPSYPGVPWSGDETRASLYRYFVSSGECLLIIIEAYGWRSYPALSRRTSGPMQTWPYTENVEHPSELQKNGLNERMARAFAEATVSFKFFPSFLLLGYVG